MLGSVTAWPLSFLRSHCSHSLPSYLIKNGMLRGWYYDVSEITEFLFCQFTPNLEGISMLW